MICQIIKNRFDNILQQYDLAVSEAIKTPVNVKKEDCPLWKFVTIKENKRSSENYDKILALELDFDGTVSIKEFEEKYKKFEFFLYTTSSHSSVNNKFRVIVPLAFPVVFSIYQDRIMKECLVRFFEGIDKSCFANFHNVPNKPQTEGEQYYYKINLGEKFSFELLRKEYKRIQRKEQHKQMMKPEQPKNMTEHQRNCYKNAALVNLKKELSEIPAYKNGSRYNSLCSVTGKMCSAKYPEGEFLFELVEIKEWILGHTHDRRVESMIESLYRKRT